MDIVTVENKKAGSVDLDPAVFDATVKPHLFHAEVRRQLALRRRGTHSTKNRARVSGGGAKPWRQKGTGRARQGTSRAVQWAGGGSAFGPVPRSYDHKLPKKVRRAALRAALSLHAGNSSIIVVDEFGMSDFRTKRVVEILAGLGLAGQRVLIVTAAPHAQLEASARNLRGVGVIRAVGLNVYDTLRHDKLVLTREAVDQLQARLGGESVEESA